MKRSIEWVEKYRPQSLADIVGNKKAVSDMHKWALSWNEGIPEKRAILIHGQAGIGKTSAAHALARDMEWETIELNASDQRTAKAIEKVAGSASQMGSLQGSLARRLIILDEADNMHGNADRGGARSLGIIIKKTEQPIILIANDSYGLTPTLRSLCQEIKFNSIQARSMLPALKRICYEEKIMCGAGVLEKLTENAGGDLRSAIKDLQAIAVDKEEIYVEDIVTSERDTKESIFKVVGRIFKGNDPKRALETMRGLDENPENFIHWVDENLPLQYGTTPETFEDVRTGYEYLSRADMYLGRVRKRQNYRLWRYASAMMSCGTVVAKSHVSRGFSKYQPPSFWRKKGQLKAKGTMRDNIASRIAQHCNKSMRYAKTDLTHLYTRMLKDEELAIDVAADLELTVDELVYLTGGRKVTKKIQKIYDLSLAKRKHTKEEGALANVSKPVKRDSKTTTRTAKPEKVQIGLNDIVTKKEGINNNGDNTNPAVEQKEVKKQKPQKTLFDF